jgi:hypothetical protein
MGRALARATSQEFLSAFRGREKRVRADPVSGKAGAPAALGSGVRHAFEVLTRDPGTGFRRAVLGIFVAASAVAGCGPAGSEGARMGAAVAISGLVPSQVAVVQLTVLSNGQRFNCEEVKRTCLSQQIDPAKDAIPLRGGDGKEHRSLRFELSGDRLLSSGDTATLMLPPGTNYLVVAEVFAASGPGWLLASGCEIRDVVTSGDNPALNIAARALASSPHCDPHID